MRAAAGNAMFAVSIAAYTLLTTIGFFFIEEDAYIYFRSAENIAAGHGYAFNPGGPPLETGSGPLWQLLLALGALLGAHPVLMVKTLGYGFGVATLWLVNDVGRRLCSPVVGGMAAFALAVSVPFVWWSGSGLEVAAHTFVVMSCVRLAPLPGAASVLRALPFAAILYLRPEGFLYVACFVGYFLLGDRKRFAYLVATVAAGSYLAYEIFRLVYFHDLQISAFYAKTAYVVFEWRYLWFVIGTLGLWLAVLPVPLALLHVRDRDRRAAMALLAALTAAGIYFAVINRDFKVYYRFFALCLPQLSLLCAVALHEVLNGVRSSLKPVIGAYGLLAVAMVAWRPELPAHWDKQDERLSVENPYMIAARTISADPSAAVRAYLGKLSEPHSHSRFGERLQARVPFVTYENYQAAVGLFLRDNYPRGLLIAYDQMGQTPYLAAHGHRFIDMLGLANREIGLAVFNHHVDRSFSKRVYKRLADPLVAVVDPTARRDVTYRDNLAMLVRQDPDIVLLHAKSARATDLLIHHVARSQWLQQRYVPKYVLCKWVAVFERRDHDFPLRVRAPRPILELTPIR